MSRALCFVTAALAATGVCAQDKAERVSVHVKSVHREATESTKEGTWYQVTVTADSKTVAYSLSCREFLSNGKKDYTVRCKPLSAGLDYSGFKVPNGLSFWKPEDKGKGYLMAVYEIDSENEK